MENESASERENEGLKAEDSKDKGGLPAIQFPEEPKKEFPDALFGETLRELPAGGVVVKMTRERASDFKDGLMTAGNISLDERDNEAIFRKFKYACGKNFEKCKALDAETDRLQQALLFSKAFPKYDEFETEREKLCLKHCARDEAGNAVVKKKTGSREQQYGFTGEGWAAYEPALRELRALHQAAIDEYETHLKAVDAIGQETVEISLHAFPFAYYPVRLNATHLAAIAEMLTGRPADV